MVFFVYIHLYVPELKAELRGQFVQLIVSVVSVIIFKLGRRGSQHLEALIEISIYIYM